MSGAIIDPDRLVIGTEEGLFCLDLDRNGKLPEIFFASQTFIIKNYNTFLQKVKDVLFIKSIHKQHTVIVFYNVN